jgi:hypothetical protein
MKMTPYYFMIPGRKPQASCGLHTLAVVTNVELKPSIGVLVIMKATGFSIAKYRFVQFTYSKERDKQARERNRKEN